MAIRKRSGMWHHRFKLGGRSYSGTTDLAATQRNESDARQLEADHRKALLEGRSSLRRLTVCGFATGVGEFLEWAKSEYRAHPNSYKRIRTSMTSAKELFKDKPLSAIYEAELEAYKVLRINTHEVCDVTVRHDLHALSKLFQYAMKQNWTRENPTRNVKIPSDDDAVRIHVITPEEEKEYFARAAGNQNLSDLARLMRNQGMRPDDMLSMPKEDVDLQRGQMHIKFGKSKASRRTLDLTAGSIRILARRCQNPSKWIFPSPVISGAHILRLNGAHDAACVGSNTRPPLYFVLYDWRHTFATRAAQAKVDLATLAAILGHGSLRIV